MMDPDKLANRTEQAYQHFIRLSGELEAGREVASLTLAEQDVVVLGTVARVMMAQIAEAEEALINLPADRPVVVTGPLDIDAAELAKGGGEFVQMGTYACASVHALVKAAQDARACLEDAGWQATADALGEAIEPFAGRL